MFAWKEIHQVDGEEREVIVHRKGATPAGAGVLGIIPGSMASLGYVVRDNGLPQSLHSASHGAGRIMSRAKAMQSFTWSATRPLRFQHYPRPERAAIPASIGIGPWQVLSQSLCVLLDSPRVWIHWLGRPEHQSSQRLVDRYKQRKGLCSSYSAILAKKLLLSRTSLRPEAFSGPDLDGDDCATY